MSNFTWHGDRFLERQRRQYATLVGIAGANLAERMKSRVGIQGPPPSTPGNPPHVDTGELQASINATPRGGDSDHPMSIVGSSVPQAGFTEFGTSRMAARPWCQRTLKESKDQIRRDLLGQ